MEFPMKRILISTAAAFAFATLSAGCSGPTHTVEDPEGQGVIETDAINWRELRPAVDDMLAELSRLNAQGWPKHVVMTPEPPHKAQVRIHTIQNRTRERLDVVGYKNELLNALTKQGIVYVVGDEHDMSALAAERDYAENSGNVTQKNDADEDAVGLVIQGEIVDYVIDQENVKQHDYQFNLRLYDTKKNRMLATTSTKFRKTKRR